MDQTTEEREDEMTDQLQTRISLLREELARLEAEQARNEAERRQAEAEQAKAGRARQQRLAVYAILAKDEADFYAKSPQFDVRPYVLPFGRDYAKFNPLSEADRQAHEFGPTWMANCTAIICKKDERTRPTRLIWTSGMAGEHDLIGQRFEARHDQSGARLGEYEIVGLAFYGTDGRLARVVGNVPNIKLAQSTYK